MESKTATTARWLSEWQLHVHIQWKQANVTLLNGDQEEQILPPFCNTYATVELFGSTVNLQHNRTDFVVTVVRKARKSF
jgi:hypothetical protein